MRELDQATLKSFFHYDPKSGVWTRLRGAGRPCAYHVPNCNGYIMIMVNRQRYLAHRLAFLYVTGAWPRFEVDHINGVRHDNRWENLRDVTRSENQLNPATHRAATGGVYWSKVRKHWYVVYKAKYCGCFKLRADAISRLREVTAQG